MTTADAITPREYARQLGVAADKVLHWIHTGQLRALNLAADPNGERPRFRITREAREAFERSRSSCPAPPAPTRRKRQAVKDYFA